MPIDLPLTPGPVTAEPYFIDAGGWQKPITQGDPTRVDLLGDKFGLSVTMPPMTEAEALVWVRRLNKGRGEGVTFEFPANYELPLFNLANSKVAGNHAAQATQITLQGMGNKLIEEGRFFSIHHDGYNYLHQADAEVQAVSGTGPTVPFLPRARVAFASQDVIDFDRPKIDGILLGNETGWTVSTAIHYGLQFQIEEMR